MVMAVSAVLPILLLDLVGLILVAGYALGDRRQNPRTDHHHPKPEPVESAPAGVASPPSMLPVEPIIAQRRPKPDGEPRLLRRPDRRPVSRSDEA